MNEILIIVFSFILFFFLHWGFKNLPLEKWQILWSVPQKKLDNGSWQGTNFTFYGVFNATGITLATIIMFILMGALKFPVKGVLFIALGIFAVSLPSAKILAYLVEKKHNTFSVGGASFMGIIIAPWIAWIAVEWVNITFPIMGILASLSISYAFGEGVGRLACISFGCCYGKSLENSGKWMKRIFQKHHFVFYGNTKKISYAHGLDGHAILPIQAVTSVIFCFSGITGLFLFVNGFFSAAFLEVLTITQIWRFVSEFFRYDYRGKGSISIYQILSITALIYGFMIFFFFPAVEYHTPKLVDGFNMLWDPLLIVFFQLLWVGTFIFLGRSQVTGAILDFQVHQEKI